MQDQKKQLQDSVQERDELRKKLANADELQGIVSNLYFSLVAETQGDPESKENQVQYDLQQVRTALESKWLKQEKITIEDTTRGEDHLTYSKFIVHSWGHNPGVAGYDQKQIALNRPIAS